MRVAGKVWELIAMALAWLIADVMLSKPLTGHWFWERPFCICEDCGWHGHTMIYEYAPCPKCCKWFMRIEGFHFQREQRDEEMRRALEVVCKG